MLAGIAGLAFLVTYAINSRLTQIQTISDLRIKDVQDRENQRSRVVFALKDISEGDSISADAIEERQIQTGRAPEDALTASSLALGKVAKYGIAAGQIISQHDIATHSQGGFENQLRQGARAVTFAVDNNSGVAGFVSPNSRVDVFALVGTGADTKASAVLSDVQVVAVGQIFKKTSANDAPLPTSSITVSLNPEDAQKLLKAISASKLYVALRNPSDHSPIATVDVTSLYKKPGDVIASAQGLRDSGMILPPPITALQAASEPVGRIEPPKPQYQIELWSGSKRDVLMFEGH
jgi:pilus assembly protein CpaB